MKLVIQIPCYNERGSIKDAINAIPEHVEGIEDLELQVIDDGSTDGSPEVAEATGRCTVIRLPRHLGLADAFSAGVAAAVERDADILVNLDADLQYPPSYIPDLVAPILNGEADIAIGDRLSSKPRPFGPIKMLFENLGSLFVRIVSSTKVRDAASGFRAFNREAMHVLYLHGTFTYTLESLVLAGVQRLRIANVPITINPPRRKSRLFKSIPSYIRRSITTVLRIYLMYHPLRFLLLVGSLFMAGAVALGIRFLVSYIAGEGAGHVQSLILLAILAIMGFQTIALGFVGDVVAANRRLLEDVRRKITFPEKKTNTSGKDEA